MLLVSLLALGLSAAPPAPPEEPEALQPWTGAASLSVNLHAGNTRSLLIDASGLAEYASELWVATIKLEAAFEKAAAAGEDEETIAESASLTLRGERRLSPLLGVYALAEGSTDHLASVRLRLDGELGVAFTLIDRQKEGGEHHLLRLDLGLHYSNEQREQYYVNPQDLPDVDLLSPGLRLVFYLPVTERLLFLQYAEIFPNVLGSARVLFDSTSKLAMPVTERLNLNLNLLFELDSAPAQGKSPVDLALTFGGEILF